MILNLLDVAYEAIDWRAQNVYANSMSNQGKGSVAIAFKFMAEQLGSKFRFLSPSFLVYEDYSSTIILQSPGVVGPSDENIRDRPEWCIIKLDGLQNGRIVYSQSSYGTEFSVDVGSSILPAALLGLPAMTRLEDLEQALSEVIILDAVQSQKN